MNYKKELQILRKRIPVSVTEAITMLQENNGNIDVIEFKFKEKNIDLICKETNCTKEVANRHYENLRYDTAKTLRSIKEEQYDANYVPDPFITEDTLKLVQEWRRIEKDEGFYSALNFDQLDIVLHTIEYLLPQSRINSALKTARFRKEIHFKNFSNDVNIDLWIEQLNKLKQDILYKESQIEVEQNLVFLEEELLRHARNIERIKSIH